MQQNWTVEKPTNEANIQYACLAVNCASAPSCFKDWATTNLLTTKFRRFASLREGRMSPAVSAQV